MKALIKELLTKAMNELFFMGHSIDRIKERFNIFSNEDLSPNVKSAILTNINLIEAVDFPKNKSYGIMLGSFYPNPKSSFYHEVERGRGYYQIMDDSVITDSTGDQFWIVVRDNQVTTFMLRKKIQTDDTKHNLEKLRVDYIIKNISDYIAKEKAKKQPQAEPFKRVTLKTGEMVKYFDKENKFEDLNGSEINTDSLFDKLTPEMQEIVFSKIQQ